MFFPFALISLFKHLFVYFLIYYKMNERENELQSKRETLKQSEGSEVIKGDEVMLLAMFYFKIGWTENKLL